MKKYVNRLALVTLIALPLILPVPFVSGAHIQRPERIVVRKPWPVEPVMVVAAKTKNRENIEIDKAFEEEDDWLDGFTVTVANNYHKTITAITVEIVFRREQGETKPPFSYQLHFGPSPITPEYLLRDPKNVIAVGKSADLRLSTKNYKNLRSYLDQTGYPASIKRVELEIKEVGFEDGSMLYSGTFYLQDPAYPNDPTKKIKMPQQPGVQNQRIRSPWERHIKTDISFVTASLMLPTEK
jgi:hypothetical protein